MNTEKNMRFPVEDPVLAMAARLCADELFQGGEDACCQLYMHVPLRYLANDYTAMTDYAENVGGKDMVQMVESADSVIDLLVCHGPTALIGLMCTQDDDNWLNGGKNRQNRERLAQLLKGSRFVFRWAAPSGDAAKLVENIHDYLRSQLRELHTELEDPNSDFSPGIELYAESLEDLRSDGSLVTARLLHPGDFPTDYGRDCGIFVQYAPDTSGQGQERTVAACYAARQIRALLNKGSTRDKTPLATRLERLAQGLPADGRYGEYVVNALRQLLETPLVRLCGDDTKALSSLMKALAQAQDLLGLGKEVQAITYADALKTIRLLREAAIVLDEDGDALSDQHDTLLAITDQEEALLSILGNLLLMPKSVSPQCPVDGKLPLRERLRRLGAQNRDEDACDLHYLSTIAAHYYASVREKVRAEEYPILCLPLPHYYYAASRLDGSDYPSWFYRKYFYDCRCLRTLSSHENMRDLYYPAFIVQWALKGPQEEVGNPSGALYDLLVEPVFPSVGR